MTLLDTAEERTLTSPESETEEQQLPPLYRHSRRPEWGLSLIAWERPTKRAYQFEDGELRVIKRGFYTMFEEVDVPRGRAEELVVRLRLQAGHSAARKAALTQAKRTGAQVITFSRQLEAFRAKYPGAFSGEEWTGTHRGDGRKRPLKRHRDPATASAAEKWSREQLTAELDRGGQAVIDSWRDVLNATDLVTNQHLQPLRDLAPDAVDPVARAFVELLHGEGPFEQRIDALVSLLPKASWELLTAPLMLCAPDQHIAVRAGAFKKQAAWMAPRMSHAPRPAGAQYARYLEMAQRIKALLEREGSPPRDLVDVYDFIRVSLLPATLKLAES